MRVRFSLTGVGGILVMGLGIIISGVFILRVKPNARFVAAWIAFTAVVYAIGVEITQALLFEFVYCCVALCEYCD